MRTYPAKRDSGIDWLGDIPEYWEVMPFRRILDRPLKYGANEAAHIDDPDLPRFIRITDIDDRGHLKPETFRSLPEDVAEKYLLEPGDLLFARSGSVGRTFLYDNSWGRCAFAGYLIRAQVDRCRAVPEFVSHFSDTHAYWSWLRTVSIQATIENVSADRYSRMPIPLPPLAEQQAIADFLDAKTGQIDGLVEKKRELIERLDEYRAALITRTVTRGLPPDAARAAGLDPPPPLKPSGIDWLGDIPQHWEVRRLKYVASTNDEVLSESEDPLRQIQYVDIGAVDAAHGITTTEEMVFEDAPSRARRLVRDGDTIVSTVRTYLRAIAAICDPPTEMVVSTGFAVIRPRKVEPKYMSWALRDSQFIETIVSLSTGVSYPAISATQIGSLKIPLPPLAEQQAIAAFLDAETERIDALKGRVETAIERLQEYRTALVTAAVTGQIDVKGYDSAEMELVGV